MTCEKPLMTIPLRSHAVPLPIPMTIPFRSLSYSPSVPIPIPVRETDNSRGLSARLHRERKGRRKGSGWGEEGEWMGIVRGAEGETKGNGWGVEWERKGIVVTTPCSGNVGSCKHWVLEIKYIM